MGEIGWISTGAAQNKTKRDTGGNVWGYSACMAREKKHRKSARMIAAGRGDKGGEFRGS